MACSFSCSQPRPHRTDTPQVVLRRIWTHGTATCSDPACPLAPTVGIHSAIERGCRSCLEYPGRKGAGGWRPLNPEVADFFFVPTYASAHFHRRFREGYSQPDAIASTKDFSSQPTSRGFHPSRGEATSTWLKAVAGMRHIQQLRMLASSQSSPASVQHWAYSLTAWRALSTEP